MLTPGVVVWFIGLGSILGWVWWNYADYSYRQGDMSGKPPSMLRYMCWGWLTIGTIVIWWGILST